MASVRYTSVIVGSPLPPQTSPWALSAFFCSTHPLSTLQSLTLSSIYSPALATETALCRATVLGWYALGHVP